MLNTIRQRWQQYQRRRLVNRVVRDLARRGIQVTPEEVERKIALAELRAHLAACGVTADEAIESIRRINQAVPL